jgi:hypothetical protein
MPWKTHPTKGYLMGRVVDGNGKAYDHQKVIVENWVMPGSEAAQSIDAKFHREVYTDGSGWYGLTELPPGHYLAWIDQKDFNGQRLVAAWIQPGRVYEANFGPDQKKARID